MNVKIGHAVQDERGKASGGAAGDQTLREVCFWNWYDKPWTHVIRAKKAVTREKLAYAMEAAVNNNNWGYDQVDRETGFIEAAKYNFDPAKVTKKVETDCSLLVGICCNYAGIKVPSSIYTGNELDILKKTGEFDIYTSKEYTRSSAKLKRGDILLGKGHTAIVVEDNLSNVLAADKYDSSIAGVYKTTSDLNVRCGGGTNYDILTVLKKGDRVNNYGYYSMNGTTKWMYVSFTKNKQDYIGFVSGKYLEKVK